MSTATLQDAVDALDRLGCRPTRTGDGFDAYCPIHEADGGSHKRSLGIKAGDKVPVVVNCRAGCDGATILKALGINGTAHKSASIVATYRYRTAEGIDVREKLRYEPKDFGIRHRDAAGNWIFKAGSGPAVLYRLPEVKAAIAEGRTIFVCEGEKDSDRLASLGLVATCNIEGAAQPNQRQKWKAEYTDQLSGAARVVLVPDNDDPGRAHMRHVAAQLAGKVAEVRWLELPELPEKGDVSDWLNKGHTTDEFLALVEKCPSPEEAEQQSTEQHDKRIEWLKGFAFLISDNLIAEIETGGTMKASLFDKLAESEFPNAWSRARPTVHLARSKAQFFRHDCYYPGEPRTVKKESALGTVEPLLNTYNRPQLPEPRFEATHEAAFVEHLLFISGNDDKFTEALLDFAATLVQKPGQRINWIPLLIAPAKGTGRGLLLQILTAILGKSNVGIVGNSSVGGQFHDSLIYKQLICIDEFKMFEDSNAKLNEFKAYATEPRVPANRKGRAEIVVDNVACFIAFSNYENAIAIDRDERRYAVATCYAAPKPREYYQRLAAMFLPDSGGNVAGLLHMLLNRDLTEFNPYAPAIVTEARDSMIDRGLTPAQRYLKRWADERQATFAGDLFTFDAFEAFVLSLKRFGGPQEFADFKCTPHSLSRALNAMGAKPLGQKRLGEGRKASVYAIRDIERWQRATEGEIRENLDLSATKPPA